MVLHLYALRQSGTDNVAYRLARSERELWDSIIDEDFLGIGRTRESLKRDGWRAIRVTLLV